MFHTSSCYRKLPTHSQCHAEFLTDFPFPFPFSPFLNFFSSKFIQRLLSKPSSPIVPMMTPFLSLTGVCLLPTNFDCLFVPLLLAASHHLLHRIVLFGLFGGFWGEGQEGCSSFAKTESPCIAQAIIILIFKMFDS